ncbi:MAG TPA: SulP family inorganic anion transporter, partial [Aeromicrobium sp.]
MSPIDGLRSMAGDVGRRLGELAPRGADLRAMGRSPRADIVAGLTVAVVALPLALAFGVASGLGAQAGLVTAIVAGVVAAVFGGSSVQVSGPTGAMTVVLVPVVHRFGPEGVLMVGFLAGLVLIAMSWARVGGWVRYLPISVVEGFTAGIAVVIALQQIPAALGVDATGERVWRVAIDAAIEWVRAPDFGPPAVALGVAGLILVGVRWQPRWPVA